MNLSLENIKENLIEKLGLGTLKLTNRKYKDDSLALHTDLYEINMAETYWDDNMQDRRAVFEAYFRKIPFDNGFAVFAGLERVIEYIKNFKFSKSDIEYLHNELGYSDDFLNYLKSLKFDGDMKALQEGELVFENETMVRVDTKLAQGQLLETPILNIVNFHPLIATKAARIKNIVGEDELFDKADLLEFGMRRAHEFDAALYGARAAYIGGFTGTSNVRAGKLFGIPVKGTHAHSMVQVYGDEYIAFKKFAKRHKNCIFLVDTYDTLKSGVPNAIKVAKELGNKINFVGIRLDSGDLGKLSIEARKMLDEAGFSDAKIFASNDLDEKAIKDLKERGAKIDGWGIGTKLITAYDQPALGAVYKLVALEDENGNMVDTIKLSETPEKATTPGLKKILRVTNLINNKYEQDIIMMENEFAGHIAKDDIKLENIHKSIFEKGKLVYKQPSIEEIRTYCINNLKMLKNTIKDIKNHQKYSVTLSEKCAKNKLENIDKAKERIKTA